MKYEISTVITEAATVWATPAAYLEVAIWKCHVHVYMHVRLTFGL